MLKAFLEGLGIFMPLPHMIRALEQERPRTL